MEEHGILFNEAKDLIMITSIVLTFFSAFYNLIGGIIASLVLVSVILFFTIITYIVKIAKGDDSEEGGGVYAIIQLALTIILSVGGTLVCYFVFRGKLFLEYPIDLMISIIIAIVIAYLVEKLISIIRYIFILVDDII